MQQLLLWRVTGHGTQAAGIAEATSQPLIGSMSADEAVRWATQRHAATLSGIHCTLEQLAKEKRSCLAALEAPQVGNISTYCSCRLATTHRLYTALLESTMATCRVTGAIFLRTGRGCGGTVSSARCPP